MSESYVYNIVIGTVLLWGTILILVNPVARFLALSKLKSQNLINSQEKTKMDNNQIPARYFMFSGALIFAIIGLIVGIATGTFLVGFSWNKRHLPGIATLMTASFAGILLQGASNFGIILPLLSITVAILLATGLSVTSQSATEIKLNRPKTGPYTKTPNISFGATENNQQTIGIERMPPWQTQTLDSHKIERRFCGHCGILVNQNAEFCGNCGKKIAT